VKPADITHIATEPAELDGKSTLQNEEASTPDIA